ncbi:MAG: cobalamin-binding domain-containing protein [Nitrospirota bacterium]
MNNRILLIEPAYKNKYPPLGLMKIAAFHKERGDEVCFVKGLKKDVQQQMWDRIYITTLFSFYWSETINTIKYYEYSVKDPQNLFIGGPMATIMADEIEAETGYKPIKGLLNEKGKLRLPYDCRIDSIVPDYSILDEVQYKYPAKNAYFGYMTRGCIRKCPFCAVPKIEPSYVDYIPLKKQIRQINESYGEKKDLLLLDNNVLASPNFDRIIDEIKSIGFVKGAKLNNSNRYVDFNQGVDLRLLTKEKMKKLSELPIRPLRIAFDHIKLKDEYIKRIEWAAEFGMLHLSNYILYNFDDTPEDFYYRLRINVELNERLGTKIFSFPMKYIPVKNKDRKYVSKPHWNPRYLRGIQCVLQATHGVVGLRKEFFEAAFGRNIKEFKKILTMPDKYIIYRRKHENNGAAEWEDLYNSLTPKQREEFHNIVYENDFVNGVHSKYSKVDVLLSHYKKYKSKSTSLSLF